MVKTIRTKEQATKAAGNPVGGMVEKVKDFGKNIGARAKATGTAAKSHVSRNRAAYIAGGTGLAAGAITGAALARKKRAQSEN